MATTGERALSAELVVCTLVITVASIRTEKAFPTPSRYVGIVLAFSFLSAGALVGEKSARICAGLGGLLTMGLLMGQGLEAINAVTGALKQKVTVVSDVEPTAQVVSVRQAGFQQQTTQTPATTAPQSIWT